MTQDPSTMSIADLLNLHNNLAEELGEPKLNSWKQAKAKLIERTAAMVAKHDVEDDPLADEEPDPLAEDPWNAGDPLADDDLPSTSTPADKPKNITKTIEGLLVDPRKLSYEAIRLEVVAAFPDAKTTARSIASIACTMRRKGTSVAKR